MILFLGKILAIILLEIAVSFLIFIIGYLFGRGFWKAMNDTEIEFRWRSETKEKITELK